MRILISRSDGLGDAICTLPIIEILHKNLLNAEIYFLGSNLSKDLLSFASNIKLFLNWDIIKLKNKFEQQKIFTELKLDVWINVFPRIELAKLAYKLKIPIRIGTSHRFYNLFYCNKRVNFSRKNSNEHEAILNLKLLSPLIKKEILNNYSFENLISFVKIKIPKITLENNNTLPLPLTPPLRSDVPISGKSEFRHFATTPPLHSDVPISGKSEFRHFAPTPPPICKSILLDVLKYILNIKESNPNSKHFILHPGGNNSRLWEIKKYIELIKILSPKNYFFYFTGSKNDEKLFSKELNFNFSNQNDISNKNTLSLSTSLFSNKLNLNIINLIGKLEIKEWIYLMNEVDGIVAASTGTLHVGAILDKICIGIYPSCKVISPNRWKPLSNKLLIFRKESLCSKKSKNCKGGNVCDLINKIEAMEVAKGIIDFK